MIRATWHGTGLAHPLFEENEMSCLHLVARVRDRRLDLLRYEEAARLWRGLRRAFPEALAVMLMPDHLHLLEPGADAGSARQRLRRCLAGFSWGRGPHLWEPVPAPEPVRDRQKLRRTWRYIALNPCRKRLVADPLEWTWSTHRDVVGAVVDPWITLQRLREHVRDSTCASAEALHGYVSGAPSVAVAGTPPAVPATPSEIPSCSLDAVLVAVAAALRIPPGEVPRSIAGRKLMVALARRQGWRATSPLAEALGVRKRTVRALRHHSPPGLPAATLCLGDTRLRKHVDSIRNSDLPRRSGWATW